MFCIRLTLSIGPDGVESRQAMRVAMRCPAPMPEEQTVGHAGVWIEARDAKGEALYRRSVATHPFESTIEVATGTSDRSFERRTAGNGGVILHAVIPDFEAARTFHILERDRSSKPRAAPKERGQVDLRKLKIRDRTNPGPAGPDS